MKSIRSLGTKIRRCFLLLLVGILRQTDAAPGDVDLSFNAGTAGWSDIVHAIAIQPDGKVISAGGSITRINPDGSVDKSFVYPAGTSSPMGTVSAIALQPDGKVLVGHGYGISRLHSDGSPDITFTNPSILDYNLTSQGVRAVALQSDGRILIGGEFRVINSALRSGIARLNSDGSLDPSFVPATSDQEFAGIFSIAVQSDGKVVIGGQFVTARNDSVARLNADGSLDDADFFAVPSSEIIWSVAVQPDGKVVVGGSFNGGIARLNANGSVDANFNAGGAGADRGVLTVALDPSGKILAGGDFLKFNGANRARMARLNADGTLDSSFDLGPGLYPSILAIAVLPSGKLFIGGADLAGLGEVNPYDFLARIDADGTRDGTFTTEGTGVQGAVSWLLPLVDNSVVISGAFNRINRTDLGGQIARLHVDGSWDTEFDPGGPAGKFFAQADGKIIVCGITDATSGLAGSNEIVRFNADWTVDSTFSFPGGLDGAMYAALLQPDGKLLIGGAFSKINETNRNGLARLNADGTIDTTYSASIFASTNRVRAIAMQADGKALIGGELVSANNPVLQTVVRLDANGSADDSFNSEAVGEVTTIIPEDDGKVLIGGWFIVPGRNYRPLGRLNADGTLDGSFDSGAAFDGAPGVSGAGQIAVVANGKLLVDGGYDFGNDEYIFGIFRLHTNGSLDNSFSGTEIDGAVSSFALQADGNILISGRFNTVNGAPRSTLARIFGDLGALPNIAPSVTINSPAAGTTFLALSQIAILASASDSDGTITRVDFYFNEALIGSDNEAPYEGTWHDAAAGSYSITAVVTDDAGATTVSAPVTITVEAPASPLPPSSLTAKKRSRSRIDLTWTDNSDNELGFKIERSVRGKPFKQIATVASDVTAFSNKKLSAGTKYTYRVRAENAAGDSPYSGASAAKTRR